MCSIAARFFVAWNTQALAIIGGIRTISRLGHDMMGVPLMGFQFRVAASPRHGRDTAACIHSDHQHSAKFERSHLH